MSLNIINNVFTELKRKNHYESKTGIVVMKPVQIDKKLLERSSFRKGIRKEL